MTTNEVALRPAATTTLSISEQQTYWTDGQKRALAQIGMVNKEGNPPPDGDLMVFFHQCVRTGLDPFTRQVYLIERFNNGRLVWTPQTGIDGFRLIARRAADRLHESHSLSPIEWVDDDGVWRDFWPHRGRTPVAARVTVYRGGDAFPAVAMFDEYAGTKKDGSLTSMWANKSAHMIGKCAEALALRKAFPNDLSGLYTDDELDGAGRRHAGPRSTRGVQSPAELLRPSGPTIAHEEPVDAEYTDVPPEPEPDPVTGEVPMGDPTEAWDGIPVAQPGQGARQ